MCDLVIIQKLFRSYLSSVIGYEKLRYTESAEDFMFEKFCDILREKYFENMSTKTSKKRFPFLDMDSEPTKSKEIM